MTLQIQSDGSIVWVDEGDEFQDPVDYYVVDGVITHKPPYPGPYHSFSDGVWVLDEAEYWSVVRAKRDVLLLYSDWTELPSAAQRLTPTLLSAYAEYRQALRDITTQEAGAVVWPTKPE